jgi:threonine/homoserine/homoserine lactone efflux protein
MTIEIWLAFVVMAAIVVLIPGPTIILVIGHSLAHGRRSTLPLVAGVALGDFTAMSASLLGLGAIMAASAALFTAFKFIGAAYLIYMGVSMWRAQPTLTEAVNQQENAVAQRSRGSLFRNAYLVTSLNPKSIAFFIAFMPQFVRPGSHGPAQLLILGATFLLLATVNATMYAFCAERLRTVINTPRAKRVFNRVGGSALIGAGVLTAAMRRNA